MVAALTHVSILQQLAGTMTTFDNWFEILPGTKKDSLASAKPELLQDDATYYEGP